MDLTGRWLIAWSALCVALACSSSEEASAPKPDASTGGTGQAGAGGASGGTTTAGACVVGSDCSGCDTCQSWCECLAPSSVDTCVANCNGTESDGGGGAAGSAGSGAGGSATVVDCGGASCDVSSGHECCYPSGPASPSCSAQGAACYGTRIRCDGPEDCGSGQVCCARMASSGGFYSQIFCRSSCANNEVEVCGSDPKACPWMTTCQTSTVLSTLKVCK